MTSLRMRITLLLVVAIVSVVALATIAAVSVMRRPPPERIIAPVAHQVALVTRLLSGSGRADARIELSNQPASGGVDETLTRALNVALAREGMTGTAVVSERPDKSKAASVELSDGRWMIIALPDFSPPPDAFALLAGWIILIILGATAVSLYFASILTRPLKLLEASVARIGPDGVLAPLPEEGSGELQATARALNHLSARLKAAMESRIRLVAAAGHDLRTPMTRMRLRAEFLPEEEQEKWLKDIDELDRIADSAIRLVHEEVQEGAVEPVNLAALLKGLAADLIAMDYSVQLGRVDAVSVRGGPLSLQRALRNLIINAATHGKECIVELVVKDGVAEIAIKDIGPGIPSELISKAFEPFFRVDPARRQSVPGAGLGLAIAKEIIERQGGSITLTNRVRGGLLQTIRFPVAEADDCKSRS